MPPRLIISLQTMALLPAPLPLPLLLLFPLSQPTRTQKMVGQKELVVFGHSGISVIAVFPSTSFI
jgi:hypothetical protein